MFVYMCVCACMHGCKHIVMCAYMSACVQAYCMSAHASIYACMTASVYHCMCVHACVPVCMHICVFMCLYAFTLRTTAVSKYKRVLHKMW